MKYSEKEVGIITQKISDNIWNDFDNNSERPASIYLAAPEMLEALETICNECTDLSFDQLCLVKNTIRKARGEK